MSGDISIIQNFFSVESTIAIDEISLFKLMLLSTLLQHELVQPT